MRTSLTLHPDCLCEAVTSIEVEAIRGGRALEIRYRIIGEPARLSLPPPAPTTFTDGLWRGTCLEAFVRAAGEEGYVELNFAPSTQWAAYAFEGYRSGMTPAGDLGPPEIDVGRAAQALELRARVGLGRRRGLAAAPWRVGLSAVVQEADGRVSYWALRHPAGRPDFHHPDCFALDLPAPDRP